MTQSIESILAVVKRLAAEVEIDDARGSAQVCVGAAVVASIDLRDGRVLVSAQADWIPTLHRVFRSARPDANGIVFDLDDAQAGSDALAAIRRRVDVERLVPQFRAASP